MDITQYQSVEGKEKNRRPFYRQLFLTFTYMIFSFILGLSIGTPTVAVPQLKQQANSTAAVSDEMASWITSITSFVGIAWVFIVSILAHIFGRKKPMILTGLNTLAASIIAYYSKNVLYILISQLLHGLTQAAQTTVSIMVVSEFTSAKYRGVFLSLKAAAMYWGIWVANAIGTFFHYKYIGLVGIVCSVYSLVTFIFIPESPYWLACKGKYRECAVAHRWLKGTGEESEKELDTLLKTHKEDNREKKEKLSIIGYIRRYGKALREPDVFKPTLLSVLILFLINFSGKLVCSSYGVEIMKKITTSTTAAYTAMLILDGFTVAGTYLGCFLTKHFKRRTLLFTTSISCAVFLLLLFLYLYLVKLAVISENNYVSITLLVGYLLAASSGPLTLAATLFGELYPIKLRTFSVILICLASKIIYGTLLKIGPYIFKKFDVHGSFLFFALALSFFTLLSYKYLPETKDKTLQEIFEYFRKKEPNASGDDSILIENSKT